MNNNQIYISPQNENLSQLYLLLDTLVNQIEENKKIKEGLLSKIDNLDSCIRENKISKNKATIDNGSNTSTDTNASNTTTNSFKQDITIFQNFIDRSSPSLNEGDSGSNDQLEILRQQNVHLKNILDNRININERSFNELSNSEDSLMYVTEILRQHVYVSHLDSIKILKSALNDKIYASHEQESQTYIDTIDELDKLMAISKCYSSLLKILPTEPSNDGNIDLT
ncbi:hypothetical protein Kpol_467p6 [Vanderwaltozyma polyspora DSM 70294]|uniref:Uncharacterized protein n=1 Tax=Vanderwaltozyma polyspora (strain ATCC 22028 / DSM 70294 / BCRC 21397 / CBS 2163 / NBRC 10782 / NRRL Y-8283 / UCD 57-17) TaxID=436907 RepID=A7TQF0_VANPO|nr:uncharacterized protein Kpol_467p6 [Vanderwaltozyma polyspora DSM 70294]EDO15494.1 hypothetical protein Kpol_467p6 [Vanderwaltozyma polyspora DSM 70294]